MKYPSIPKAIRLKIDLWQDKNEKFKQALVDNNSTTVESLLEEGFPFYIHQLLTEDEIRQIGDADYDDLTDDFYKDLSDSFEKIYLQEEKRSLFELLATYLLFQRHEISYKFRQNYFRYTKNYDDGLKYAEILINTFGFLKDERSSWLLGALYNENDEFFDKFYQLYKDAGDCEEGNNISTLTGKIRDDGKYYNINSWKKHYENYFPVLVEKRFRANEDNDIDVYSVVILDLIRYPLQEYENGIQDKKLKVKPIIDFLLEDFSSFSIIDLPNLEYMMVYILFEKERELLWELSLEDKKSVTRVSRRTGRVSRQFKSLSLDSALKRNTEKLNYYINKSISENNSEECLDVFTEIGLPKDRYKVLDQYVELSKATSSPIDLQRTKKVNKI
jgi:hypothetical protein